MIALIVTALVLFVWAVVATAGIIVARANLTGRLVAKQSELDAFMRVGKWHQDRVTELEEETRSLASQVILGGSVPMHAMPLPGRDDYAEYASDDTGLVVERLDPRDLPIS